MFNLTDFSLDSLAGFELDFDLDDFAFEPPGQPQTRIMKPVIDRDSITQTATFSNAVEFAKQIDLADRSRLFAWVNGNFIFGDVIEALYAEKNVVPEEICISTLSISQENIDSLKTLLLDERVKKLYMCVSAYFYSHEKFNLVPYLYQELDYEDKFQIAFGNYHGKIITLKTAKGNTITMHGSANMRSSNSIEQIMVEINNAKLHDFNADIIKSICSKFGTINYKKPNIQRGTKLWHQVAAEAGGAERPAKQQRQNAATE